jgi:two-component system, NtrC family, sensor histidine kinase PilS
MDAQPGTESAYPSWSALRWLFLFRLLMVVGLVLAFSPAASDPALARSDNQLAWNVLVVYAVLVLLSGLGLSLRRPSRISQVQLAIFTDILVYTALMHTAGGVTSGLGILLAVAVAAGALMLEGRLSLLFAALASLAVISEQIYSAMLGGSRAISFTQAGLLGLLFFTVALLAHVLYRRVRSAEALAATASGRHRRPLATQRIHHPEHRHRHPGRRLRATAETDQCRRAETARRAARQARHRAP